MEDTEKRVIQYYQELVEKKTVYSFGDMHLYKMCRDALISKNKEDIASTIWLIGRSYAASPEREIKKAIIKGYGENKEKQLTSEDLFERFAEALNDAGLLINEMINDIEYCYERKRINEDVEILYRTVGLIRTINHIRLAVSGLPSTNNIVSFCSKFLHFYMPQSVFLFDQISLNGGKRIFESIKSKTEKKEVCNNLVIKDFQIEECKDIYNDLNNFIDETKIDKVMKEYFYHACRCYSLAVYLNNKVPRIKIYDEVYSMPRLVDSILLRVGHTKEDK